MAQKLYFRASKFPYFPFGNYSWEPVCVDLPDNITKDNINGSGYKTIMKALEFYLECTFDIPYPRFIFFTLNAPTENENSDQEYTVFQIG